MSADPNQASFAALDLSLPAGSYLITAKAVVVNSTSSTIVVTCDLVDAGSWDGFQYATQWDLAALLLCPTICASAASLLVVTAPSASWVVPIPPFATPSDVLPPGDTDPPPVRPVPELIVNAGLARSALVTAPCAIDGFG
jgi:hypothetical protein